MPAKTINHTNAHEFARALSLACTCARLDEILPVKTLLLAPYPPCPRFTGTIMTEGLCRFLEKDHVVCVSPLRDVPPDLEVSEDLAWMPVHYLKPPFESTIHIAGGRLKPLTALRSLHNQFLGMNRLIKETVEIGKQHGVDRVWCILQGPVLCRLGSVVARKLGVPLYTQIWDYPKYWACLNRFDPLSTRLMLQAYNESVRTSACCAAASPEMAGELTKEYKVPSVPIVGALDSESGRRHSGCEPGQSGEIVIGMAGQLYANGAWIVLLKALDQLDWRINGKDVRVRYMGYNSPVPEQFLRLRGRRACIEYLGFRPQSEIISILAACDLLYVPFFSGAHFHILARTSFPAKLATYCAAGRPVLFHGPDYAPPARFVRETQAGTTCDSQDPDVVVRKLHEMLDDSGRYQEMAENAHKAFHEHLTFESQRRDFMKFITYADSQDNSSEGRSSSRSSSHLGDGVA